MPDQTKLNWTVIRQKAGPYPQAAFQFVRDGLQHTVKMVHGGDGPRAPDRHVDGQQLCIGLRDYAVDRYGLLARMVLFRWGITRTDDFGRIVFAMVEGKLMQATESDTIRDFESVYSFEEAFDPSIRLDRVSRDGLEPDAVTKE